MGCRSNLSDLKPDTLDMEVDMLDNKTQSSQTWYTETEQYGKQAAQEDRTSNDRTKKKNVMNAPEQKSVWYDRY